MRITIEIDDKGGLQTATTGAQVPPDAQPTAQQATSPSAETAVDAGPCAAGGPSGHTVAGAPEATDAGPAPALP